MALPQGRDPGDLGSLVGVFRHHAYPGPRRLDGPRPGGALEGALPARGGVRAGRTADGRRAGAHHRPAPDPLLHEPPAPPAPPLAPTNDPGRARSLLPGPRPPPADRELGRAAERGAERQRGGTLPLAADAGDPGDPGRARLQLHGRRPARRGRPLRLRRQAGAKKSSVAPSIPGGSSRSVPPGTMRVAMAPSSPRAWWTTVRRPGSTIR